MTVARGGAPKGKETRRELVLDQVDGRGWGSTCSWLDGQTGGKGYTVA